MSAYPFRGAPLIPEDGSSVQAGPYHELGTEVHVKIEQVERKLDVLEQQLSEKERELEYSKERAETAFEFARRHADAESKALVLGIECEELESELLEAVQELGKARMSKLDYEELAESAEERAYRAEEGLYRAEQRAREAEQRVIDLEARLGLQDADREALTGLPGPHLLRNHLEFTLHAAHRYQRKVALMLFGLLALEDEFELQRAAARRLRTVFRDSDVLARLDERTFAVILPEHTRDENIISMVRAVACRAVGLFEQPLAIQGREVYTLLAFGVSLFPKDGQLAHQLLDKAELALGEARMKRRPGLTFAGDVID